ncbi:hypothetical protein PVK63_19495 [Aliivibrio sp. S2TY2]|uniref:hypothetical protein n=1 Tax=unclassified Aliivibrio TaxID=2645654 RepID=UPI0023787BAD|nr:MULTISPECIES: hypothetical protein [unclassified Aliivibrio]MDD9177027.1 hypothetical protein [Aliivibrio sp. S3TY1]MDD9194134.1 hypothetical protein [Aliivibrio sp. S2TY2]
MQRAQFIDSIHAKTKVNLTFFSKEDGRQLTRLCAPMDFGPSRRANNKDDRYHLWDYESDKRNHVLSLLPGQVISIEFLDSDFCPSEFITWQPNWFVSRDWGIHS